MHEASPIAIVHLITGLSRGGAETMLAKLVGGMDRRQFRNAVVSLTSEGPVGAEIRDAGIPVHSLGIKRGTLNPLAPLRVRALLKRFQPEIVQTWLYHADLLGLVARTLPNRPALVWNIRCTDPEIDSASAVARATRRVLAWSSTVPDCVIANSETGRELHRRRGYQPRRWGVIPNGFDLRRFRPDPAARSAIRRAFEIPDNAFAIGLPAGFRPMKDHETFIRAAARFATACPEARFLLVGQGMTAENAVIVRLLHESGVAERFVLAGERADMERILPALDLAVLTSNSGEGFPNVFGEAMACAVPCVGTDIGDIGQIVADTGVILPPRDPDAFAAAFERMWRLGPERRSALGVAARDRITRYYSLPAIVRRYEELYCDLAAAGEFGRVRNSGFS